VSLRQRATDKIREAILSGVFTPGQRLVEKDLGQSLGISRTVLREALQHLQAEGLINNIPYKGPVVSTLSLQDANELYEVRGALESLACAGFARHASQEQVARLREALAFLHWHRAQLRGLQGDPQAMARGAGFAGAAHPPDAVLDALNARLAAAHRAGMVDGFGARALSARLGGMALAQAGCERIAATPLPYVYSLLIYRTSTLYCLLLPLALIGPAGWLTPLFVAIVAYVFLGLAEVTEELSHPFGATLNALPLDAVCRAAEISLAPHLGEAPPEPLRAVNFHLG